MGSLTAIRLASPPGGAHYNGRVNGNTMEGSSNPGASWKATRAGK